MKYKYYSQFKQDKFLNKVVFNNKKNGFFIDIGAHDGQTINNSLFFELNNNWNGICVEPNPNVFEKLKLNRKSLNLNVCIGESNKTVKFTQIEGYSEMLSGISENYNERHIDRIKNALIVNGGKKKEIDFKMITLDIIKTKLIDFISIDTEGNEFEILSSINFQNLDIKVIVIENNYNDSRIKKHLVKFGYHPLINLDVDEVYLKKKYFSTVIKFRLKIWKLKLLLVRILAKLKINNEKTRHSHH